MTAASSPMTAAPHIPVMLAEVLAALAPCDGEIFIDGTFGAGGYTRAILDAARTEVIGLDRDPAAIRAGFELVAAMGGRLRLVEERFGALDKAAASLGVREVDGVVLDIGVSSMQFDQAERGFSFRFDGPLDMRMESRGPSAADLVNTLPEGDLARIFQLFGEERRAGALARAIVTDRVEHPFLRTSELAALCGRVIRSRPGDIHPATRAFQALRIAVNHELDELANALFAAERILRDGGRLVVVSFHSLEDRIVKTFLLDRSKTSEGGSRHRPDVAVPPPTFTLSAKGAVAASTEEAARNPRARSAKLRAARRTAAPARRDDRDFLGIPDPTSSAGARRR
jgi:16S rRNA (cytosine1402-N4)-methyltransferase